MATIPIQFKKTRSEGAVLGQESQSSNPARDSHRSASAATLGHPVKETHTIVRDYDTETGNKMINNYMIIGELGRGMHGKVKLAMDCETNQKWV